MNKIRPEDQNRGASWKTLHVDETGLSHTPPWKDVENEEELINDISRIVTILQHAGPVIEAAIRLSTNRTKRGGYLCATDRYGKLFLMVQIGYIETTEVAWFYKEAAYRNADRLSKNIGDLLSSQMRSVSDADIGAVRCKDMILSFAGLDARVSEACAVVIAVKSRNLEVPEIGKIEAVAGNPYIDLLFGELA